MSACRPRRPSLKDFGRKDGDGIRAIRAALRSMIASADINIKLECTSRHSDPMCGRVFVFRHGTYVACRNDRRVDHLFIKNFSLANRQPPPPKCHLEISVSTTTAVALLQEPPFCSTSTAFGHITFQIPCIHACVTYVMCVGCGLLSLETAPSPASHREPPPFSTTPASCVLDLCWVGFVVSGFDMDHIQVSRRLARVFKQFHNLPSLVPLCCVQHASRWEVPAI